MGFVAYCLVLSCVVLLAHSQLVCPPLPSRPVPTNIADVHPNDIKVVMSLGDSITAGFGLMGLKGLIMEYRGQSWCIGADDNATTAFNFFKTYNPNLIGGSLGRHVVEICIDPDCPDFQYEPTLDVLNAAQSGAQVDDLLNHEMDYLLGQLKGNNKIDMQNDWKVLTLLIGANDLCGVCTSSNPYNEPNTFETGLTAVLEKIRTNIPRVFVNLIPLFNLSGVYTLSLQSDYCIDVHKEFSGECDCIFNNHNGTIDRPLVDTITQLVNQKLFVIQDAYRSKNYTDFAAVVQPFASKTNISALPFDFISTLDCFHPSLFAHQALGIGLWNNMLTPSANKQNYINVNDKPICPTADTLLYTY